MIHGKKVSLRPMEVRDQLYVHDLNADPTVRGHVVGWEWPSSAYQQERWFSSTQRSDTHRWIVADRDDQPIGLTGLWDVDWHNRNALTALKIGGGQPRRGHGFGTDAIKTVMAYAFYDVGLVRLYSSILNDNLPSINAYVNKCSWSIEGTSRSHVWRHGKFVDLLQIGVLKDDFDRLPDSAHYIDLIMNGLRAAPEDAQ